MAKIEIAYNPELSVTDIIDIFNEHFASKYSINYSPVLFGTDFSIEKSGWTGAAVKYILKHEKQKAFIRYSGFAPSVLVRMFIGALPLLIVMIVRWPGFLKEIGDFIKNSEKLRAIPNQ